jgi:hypothetical protein
MMAWEVSFETRVDPHADHGLIALIFGQDIADDWVFDTDARTAWENEGGAL